MAKKQITNEAQLGNILHDAMREATEYVMAKMFQENEQLIEKYVYDAYPGEHYYDRTKQFLDAWNYKVKKTSDHHNLSFLSNRVFGEFYYDPDVMDYIPDGGQHGTPSNLPDIQADWGDAREYLADIIYNGKSSHLFGEGPWTRKRDAWSALVNKLDRGKIFTWFEEGMAKQKLKVYKR